MRIVALPSARWLTERQPFFGLISGVPGEPDAKFSKLGILVNSDQRGADLSRENWATSENFFATCNFVALSEYRRHRVLALRLIYAEPGSQALFRRTREPAQATDSHYSRTG